MEHHHDPGAPSVYHDHDHTEADNTTDTDNIDDETPEQLSPDQMDRHIAAVTAQLHRHGLHVHACDDRAPHRLRVDHPDSEHEIELWIEDDRSAVWETTAGAPEGTTSTTLATQITTAILGPVNTQ